MTDQTAGINLHCESPWPHDGSMDLIVAQLVEASSGAVALANLLHANDCIADRRASTDDPDRFPLPFTPGVVCGLQYALNTCLRRIECMAESLQDYKLLRHPMPAPSVS